MTKSKSLASLTAVVLALSLNVSCSVQIASATKLQAKPLPSERELKDFGSGQSVIIPQSATRFNRRPDYREEERLKKEAEAEAARKAEEARQQALEAQKQAQQQQIQNYQKYQQMAVDANNRAVQLGKQSQWMEAIAEHEKAVQYDPRNKQFRINLSAARTAYGQQRMAAKDYGTACHMFRKAVSAASDNALAQKMLVEALSKQGIDAGSADARLDLGDKLQAAGDFEGATIEYQAAMQLENSARTYVKMGDMSLRYGQIQQAMTYYRQAIVKDPDYGPAHRQMGFLQMSRGDLTLAATSLRKAVICDSKDTAAGQSLVEIWRKQVAQNPLLAENHLGLAGALQLTGDFVGADSEYRKLEALDPKNPGLAAGRASLARTYEHAKAEKHKLAAETLMRQGLGREALMEVSQAVRLEPKNAKYQLLLGRILELTGDYNGANQAYLTAVLIDPENNEEAAERMRDLQTRLKMPSSSIAQLSNRIAGQLTGHGNQQHMQNHPQMQQHMQQPNHQQSINHSMHAQNQNMQTQSHLQQMHQQMQSQAQGQNHPGKGHNHLADGRGQFRVLSPDQSTQQMSRQLQPQINQQQAPQKSMFEGGGAGQSFGRQPFNFNTHDESESTAQAAQQESAQQAQHAAQQAQHAAQQAQHAASQQQSAAHAGQSEENTGDSAATMTVSDALARVSFMESQKDYSGAAHLLKEMLSNHLQNAELHHRLAVNLLGSGQISEAVSEFRIASALSPDKKMYSDDLARALAIHKRSLMSDKGEAGAGR